MPILRTLRRRLRLLADRPAFERDLDDEVRFHLEMQTARNVERGMAPDDARALAEREFGRVALVKDQVRDTRGATLFDDVRRDLRHAVRALRSAPVFTIVAVLCLALGIGANAAIFSVVNAVLLRPLPYAQPDRLVQLYESQRRDTKWFGSVSWPNFVDWRREATDFAQLVAYQRASATLLGEEGPERVQTVNATANVFAALGVAPLLGRGFAPDEDQPGRAAVVVLSQPFWESRFGGDRAVVGRTVRLDGVPRTVIGVMPAHFTFPVGAAEDAWLPFVPDSGHLRSRGSHFLAVVGRLRPGVDTAHAGAQLREIAARIERQYPDEQSNRSASLVPLRDVVVGGVRPALLVLLGAVALVLLIACANVASLLLARTAARRHEVAVRLALGAGRARLVRQFLVESLVLALVGGVAGAVLARWSLSALAPLARNALPRSAEIALDGRVFLFLLVIATLSGVLFGIAPALQAARTNLRDHLADSGAKASAGGGHQRVRSALVVAEIALSLVLLVGAGLLMRGFLLLSGVEPGLDPRGVLTARIATHGVPVADSLVGTQYLAPMLERTRALPGVQSAGVISMLPIQQAWTNLGYGVVGEVPPEKGQEPNAEFRIASADFFRTLGIPVVAGRDFGPQDGAAGRKVVIINQTLARRHFANGRDPIGQRIYGFGPDTLTIVGVVGDVHQAGLDLAPLAELYAPITDPTRVTWTDGMTLVVRSSLDPQALAPQLRGVVRSVDPSQPLYRVQTMDEVIRTSLANRRLNLWLLGIFAAVALVLASAGLFGVISYLVAQRTREIGIRMALGAQRDDVLRLVVGQGARLTAVGITIGLLGAFATSRLIRSMLYGVSAHDPATFALVATVLALVALAATLAPARRALRVDPMLAIRSD